LQSSLAEAFEEFAVGPGVWGMLPSDHVPVTATLEL
jgi:exonuclease III